MFLAFSRYRINRRVMGIIMNRTQDSGTTILNILPKFYNGILFVKLCSVYCCLSTPTVRRQKFTDIDRTFHVEYTFSRV